jgi:hypothetical protein
LEVNASLWLGVVASGGQMWLGVNREKGIQDYFQKWQRRWEWCINAGGEYFKGDKAHSVAGMSEKL